MSKKIVIDDKEYDLDSFSDNAQDVIKSLHFVSKRIKELSSMQAILRRAQNSYMETLKSEVVSNKAGFIIEDE